MSTFFSCLFLCTLLVAVVIIVLKFVPEFEKECFKAWKEKGIEPRNGLSALELFQLIYTSSSPHMKMISAAQKLKGLGITFTLSLTSLIIIHLYFLTHACIKGLWYSLCVCYHSTNLNIGLHCPSTSLKVPFKTFLFKSSSIPFSAVLKDGWHDNGHLHASCQNMHCNSGEWVFPVFTHNQAT